MANDRQQDMDFTSDADMRDTTTNAQDDEALQRTDQDADTTDTDTTTGM